MASWPSFSQEEADAVHAVISSNRVNYWTGQEGRAFEREFAAWIGARHAVAVTNGTVALDLALMALGIGSGDEVIVTPRTFIASVSSVVLAGAIPVFADVDRDSGNISPATIEPMLTERTRAVVPVHLAGWPCDMPEIMKLAATHGLKVIEDCAQAHGARISGRSVGTFGEVGAWSFCQDKIMTTGGEGGMVTTDDDDVWRAMWSYKDHGKNWDSMSRPGGKSGFQFVHDSFGTNWRMLEAQAAIGRIQLGRMAQWAAARSANALAIAGALQRHSGAVRVPLPAPGATHAFYRLYAYVRPEGLRRGWSRDRIVAELAERGAPVMHGTCSEVYLEKAFDGTGLRPAARLPVAREMGETSIAFLVHPTLTQGDLDRIVAAADEVLSEAGR